MKRVLYFICLSVIIVGCKKSDGPLINLTGTWELVGQFGFGVYQSKTYPTGQGNLLQFSAGNKYEMSLNFQQVELGVYRIVPKGTTQVNKTFDAIYLGEKSFNAISIRNDSLTISTPPNDGKGNMIADGGLALYIRQK